MAKGVFMKMGLLVLSMTGIFCSAHADIYLKVGESVAVGRDRIYCTDSQEEITYKCQMRDCVDPWGKPSDFAAACKNNGSYKMVFRTAIGANKKDLYNELAVGYFEPETFSCQKM